MERVGGFRVFLRSVAIGLNLEQEKEVDHWFLHDVVFAAMKRISLQLLQQNAFLCRVSSTSIK